MVRDKERDNSTEQTMIMRYQLLFLLAGLFGCDSNAVVEETGKYSINPIDFSNLAVGQKSWYLGFEGGSSYDPDNATFQYLQDTLTVEVLDASTEGFVFLEQIRPGSTSLKLWQDSIKYLVTIRQDSLKIDNTLDRIAVVSSILPISQFALPLKQVQENETQIDGVIATPSTQEPVQGLYQTGFVLRHVQQGRQYDHLNIIIDRTDIVVDGPAYTVLYNEEAGVVRSFATSPWTGQSQGWDLLP